MKRTLGVLSLILLFSCEAKNNNSHYSPAKMQQVLEDLHLAESYSVFAGKDSVQINTQKNNDSLAVYYNRIFKHHKTNRKEFEQSLQWYKQNPEELDSIYLRMIDSMVVIQNSLPPAPAKL